MLAVYARSFSADDPLSGLVVGERPDPEPQDGWTTVQVKAAALNHHDLWSLKGVGLKEAALPMILGCDAAGLDEEGNEVVVHAVVSDPSWSGDETLDPKRSLLSERYQGTFADRVLVPRRNVVPKPASLSFEEAACLPTAWLTAYRMLFVRGGLKPGDSVLVQGAGGGVSTALVALGRAAGLRVYATSRDEAKRSRALELGAHEVFETNARLPGRVDAVMETVGRATWSHSVKSLRPGGTLVVSGTTSGPNPENAELTRVFFLQLRVIGSTMGTRSELAALTELLDVSGVRPLIDRVLPMEQARDGFAAMAEGELFGKVVFARCPSPPGDRLHLLRQPDPLLVVGVVEACQPGREPLHRHLELRERVHELLHAVGHPRQRDLFVAPSLLELLEPAVGEVHLAPAQLKACCISVLSSSTCRECCPTDGEEDSGRETRRNGSPSSSGVRLRAKCGQAPMIAGSSCTHRSSSRCGYLASSALSSATGRG